MHRRRLTAWIIILALCISACGSSSPEAASKEESAEESSFIEKIPEDARVEPAKTEAALAEEKVESGSAAEEAGAEPAEGESAEEEASSEEETPAGSLEYPDFIENKDKVDQAMQVVTEQEVEWYFAGKNSMIKDLKDNGITPEGISFQDKESMRETFLAGCNNYLKTVTSVEKLEEDITAGNTESVYAALLLTSIMYGNGELAEKAKTDKVVSNAYNIIDMSISK